jgi:hypothetical protein
MISYQIPPCAIWPVHIIFLDLLTLIFGKKKIIYEAPNYASIFSLLLHHLSVVQISPSANLFSGTIKSLVFSWGEKPIFRHKTIGNIIVSNNFNLYFQTLGKTETILNWTVAISYIYLLICPCILITTYAYVFSGPYSLTSYDFCVFMICMLSPNIWTSPETRSCKTTWFFGPN